MQLLTCSVCEEFTRGVMLLKQSKAGWGPPVQRSWTHTPEKKLKNQR